MSSDWSETQREFRRLILEKRAKVRDVIQEVADMVPMSRSQAYEIFAGRVQRPTKAVQRGIERLVRQRTDSADTGLNAASED